MPRILTLMYKGRNDKFTYGGETAPDKLLNGEKSEILVYTQAMKRHQEEQREKKITLQQEKGREQNATLKQMNLLPSPSESLQAASLAGEWGPLDNLQSRECFPHAESVKNRLPRDVLRILQTFSTERDFSRVLKKIRSTKPKSRKYIISTLTWESYQWLLEELYDQEGAAAVAELALSATHDTKSKSWYKYVIQPAIAVLLQKKETNSAFHLWNYLDTIDIPASPWLYSFAIKQFVYNGEFNNAIQLYNTTKAIDGISLEDSATRILKAMLRERKYTGIEEIADDLWDLSKDPVVPNVLELLLNAYSKAGNIQRMQDMCMHLLDQQVALRGPVIAIIISAYTKVKMRTEALDMVDVLLQTNSTMNDKIQRILISTTLSVSSTENAEEILTMLESRNLLKNSLCHLMIAIEHAKMERYDKVAALFDQAEQLGLPIVGQFFTVAVNSALKANNLPRARLLLTKCEPYLQSGEMRRDAYLTLQLTLYSREGRHNKVKYLWETELKTMANRNAALSLYLDSAGRNCDATTVLALWKSLKVEGYDLCDENLLNSYLEALLRNRHHELAVHAFKTEFQEHQLTPTAKTLITMLQPLAEKENIAMIRKLKTFVWRTYPALIPEWQNVQSMLEQQIKGQKKRKAA